MGLFAWLIVLVIGAIGYFLYKAQKIKKKDELIRGAIKFTGLKDFGFDQNPKWLEGFDLALNEAHRIPLKAAGRWWINFLLFRRLCERLRFVDYVKNHPELEKIPIKDPIFIIGLPRTGSTITYNLLALDNDVRTLKLWEIIHPTPPPSDPISEKQRIRRLSWALAFQRLWSPGLDKIHYIRANLAEEETMWFSQNNWFPGLAIGINSPPITEWFLSQEDKTGDKAFHMYQDFRNILRMRTIDKGVPSRWLFKGVLIHQHCLPALFRVFPDARVIYLRRDPCEAVASAASLETVLGGQYQEIDFKRYGPERMPMLISLEGSTQNYRRSLPPEDERKHFVDLLYKDTIADPYASIKKVYNQFGLDFSEEYSNRMTKYLADNPKGKHGKHNYSLKTYGLTDEGVRAAFAPVYGDTTPKA